MDFNLQNTVWDLFEQTGMVGYYILLKDIEVSGEGAEVNTL